MGLTDADVVLLTSRGERPKLGDRCAFCQGVETEHEDLVYCDRCNVAVHPGERRGEGTGGGGVRCHISRRA